MLNPAKWFASFMSKVEVYIKDWKTRFSVWHMMIWGLLCAGVLVNIDQMNLLSHLWIRFAERFSIMLPALPVSVLLVGGSGVVWCCFSGVMDKKWTTIDERDFWLWSTILLLIVYMMSSLAVPQRSVVGYWCTAVAVLQLIFCGILRIGLFRVKKEKREAFSKNEIELSSLFTNKVHCDPDRPIIIKEEEVDYDIFGRQKIIAQIFRDIVTCEPKGSHVIGVEGEWGSGKSTILNIVKRKIRERKENDTQDLIVIDEFDPWIYGDQQSMLSGMFECILEHSGVKWGYLRKKRIIDDVSSVLAGQYAAVGVVRSLMSSTNQLQSKVDEIERRVVEHLEYMNQKIVFFIDNLERADAQNIVLLLKLMGKIMKWPRVIFVVSYDPERLKHVLNDVALIDEHYTEKIIQAVWHVPALSVERKNTVFEKCMMNLLRQYGIQADEIEEYEDVFKCILKNVTNIRTFKRLLNSTFSLVLGEENLNKHDLLCMEVLHFLNPDLYGAIYANRKYFIRQHVECDVDAYARTEIQSDEELATERYQFIQELFKTDQNKPYYQLVESLFPQIESDQIDDFIDVTTVGDVKISSGMYFDLYFNYGTNQYSAIREWFEELSKAQTNYMNDIDDFVRHVNEQFNLIPEENYDIWYQLSSYMAYRFCDEMRAALAEKMCLSIDVAMRGNKNEYSWDSMIHSICMVIAGCDSANMEWFAKRLNGKYKLIRVMHDIVRYMASLKEVQSYSRVSERIRACLQRTCNEIVEKRINLYADENYMKGNIWVLRNVLPNSSKEHLFREYINAVFTPEYVYRIILDAAGDVNGPLEERKVGIIENRMRLLLGTNWKNRVDSMTRNLPLNDEYDHQAAVLLTQYKALKRKIG